MESRFLAFKRGEEGRGGAIRRNPLYSKEIPCGGRETRERKDKGRRVKA